MIARNISSRVLAAAAHFPVVTLSGPRQSGKTTLCRALFPDHPYVSFEAVDDRDFAATDPRAFLAQHAGGAYKRWTQRHTGVPPMFHLRTHKQIEADLMFEGDDGVRVVEAKSGATAAGAWFAVLERARRIVEAGEAMTVGRPVNGAIVYGGDTPRSRALGDLIPWADVASLMDG